MILDESGHLAKMKRHDYLPFGEEIFAPTGRRAAAMGYSGGDGLRQQFTLKERDVETGLDYFLARYYASTQGRFTSPDPLMESGRVNRPQTWNRFSYVLNNPLRFIDPNGLDTTNAEDKDQQSQKPAPKIVFDDFELGVPPPPISKEPVPAGSQILGVIPRDDERGVPYSWVSETGIQISVGVQILDQNGKPYYAENSEGTPAQFQETVTTVPGGVEAPGMEGQEPATSIADLNRGGQIGDRHRYNAAPNRLPDNLNVIRRQIMWVVDPNTGERHDVGHHEIRYSKSAVTIIDYSQGKEKAKTLGPYTPRL
jgi:RHS repeat-associated protein